MNPTTSRHFTRHRAAWAAGALALAAAIGLGAQNPKSAIALKRDGSMVAPPRMTYSSHGVPAAMRDVYRTAIDEALQRCTPLHFTARMGGAN